MKHKPSFYILLSSICLLFTPCQAQEAPALANVEDFQQKALQYLKEKRPELKSEDLVFSSIDYSYQAQPTTRKVIDTQGNEHWVTDSPFTQSLRVSFVDRSTRTEQVVAGERVAVSKLFSVQFGPALTDCVYVSNGTSTEHLH